MYVRGLLIAGAASLSAVAAAAGDARPSIGPFALGSSVEDAKRAAPNAKWETHADKTSGRLNAISAASVWSFERQNFQLTLRPDIYGTRILRFESNEAAVVRGECERRMVATVAYLEGLLGEFGPGPSALGWGLGDATVGAGTVSQIAVAEEFDQTFWYAETFALDKPHYVVVSARSTPQPMRCEIEISASTQLLDARPAPGAAKQFASDLAERIERSFVAEFKDAEAARAAWRRDGAAVLEQVADGVFPTPVPDEFAAEAIAAVRAKRAAEPAASLEALVAVALNPSGDGIAVVRIEPERLKEMEAKRPPEVTLRKLKDAAVVKIPVLVEKTPSQVHGALAEMPARLIVDLRGNQGGLFDTLARTAEPFLQPSAVVVSVVSHEGTNDYITPGPDGKRKKVALIVLIDEETNAGALALAAALVDHAKARLAGRLAKQVNGTLYTLLPLSSERGKAREGYIRFPTGVLKRPNGALLADGLKVDIPINATGEAAVAEALKAFK